MVSVSGNVTWKINRTAHVTKEDMLKSIAHMNLLEIRGSKYMYQDKEINEAVSQNFCC